MYNYEKNEKACKTKVKFDSLESANMKADFQTIVWNKKMFTYRCPHCNKWHMTKQKRKNV